MRPGRPGSGWRGRWQAAGTRVRGRGAGQDRAAGAGPRQDRPPRRRAAGAPADDRRPACGPGAVAEEEALRDLVRAREDVRGDLMRARHRMGKLLLRHDVRYDGAASTGRTPPRLAGRVELGDCGAQVDADRLPRRDRRAGDPPRRARAHDRRAGARLAMGDHRRPVALPARHRHALGRRAVRRDRRLRRASPAGAADELPRPGPVRAELRREAPPGPDHQDRLPPRPPAARRGRLALPPPTPAQQDARSAAKPASPRT